VLGLRDAALRLQSRLDQLITPCHGEEGLLAVYISSIAK